MGQGIGSTVTEPGFRVDTSTVSKSPITGLSFEMTTHTVTESVIVGWVLQPQPLLRRRHDVSCRGERDLDVRSLQVPDEEDSVFTCVLKKTNRVLRPCKERETMGV